MKTSVSQHIRIARYAAGLAAVALMGVFASACGSSGHTSVNAPPDPAPGPSASQPPTSPATAPSGKAVAVTTGEGYMFNVSLASPGVTSMISFTTDDSSGDGGTPVDAPPGSKLLVAQLVISNNSGRPEPMLGSVVGTLPADATGSQLELAVPFADASAFGVDPSSGGSLCNATNDAMSVDVAPLGYCALSTQIGAFSPAQSDITQPSQLESGTSGTVTLLVTQGTDTAWVPGGAPTQDVKAFAEPNTTCSCWSALS